VGNAIGLAGSANVVGLNTSATFNDDAWHHVAAVLDKPANRAMIYVDGQKETLVKFDNFGVTGGTLVAGDTELDITGVDYVATPSELTTRIGNTHYGQNFEGTVDEVRVYDRALTTAEVTTLFTGGN
jgi:hypothetical protein